MSESEQDRWPGLAGRIEGNRHILPVRVYFEDTDFTGVVYHGSYLRWCERGRSDWLRLQGVSHDSLSRATDARQALAFVVRKLEMKFLLPARIDEVLEVVSQRSSWGGATLTLSQNIMRGEQTLMKASVQLAMISADGRPRRLPPEITATFETENRES